MSSILAVIAVLAIVSIIWLVISDRIAIRRQEEKDRQAEQDRRDREYDAQRAAFRSKWQTPRSTAPTAKAAAAQSKRDSGSAEGAT